MDVWSVCVNLMEGIHEVYAAALLAPAVSVQLSNVLMRTQLIMMVQKTREDFIFNIQMQYLITTGKIALVVSSFNSYISKTWSMNDLPVIRYPCSAQRTLGSLGGKHC